MEFLWDNRFSWLSNGIRVLAFNLVLKNLQPEVLRIFEDGSSLTPLGALGCYRLILRT
jgi:hypothetical protein